MTKSFNVNNTVKVKLTKLGKQMLEKEHNKFWSSHGNLNEHPYKPPKEDENGYVEFQLWSLMYQLGRYHILGCELVIDTVILIDEKDLRDVE